MMKAAMWWTLVVGGGLLVACGDDDAPPVVTDSGMVDAGPRADAGGDPCAGLALCTTAGTSCAGDELVTCAANAIGCLVITRMDCTSTGAACDDSGATAMCNDDPCLGLPVADRCDTEGTMCDGDELVDCAPNADGCLVQTRTDCAEAPGGACDDTIDPVCVVPLDPCASIPAEDRCAAEGTSCVDDSLVVCAPDAFGCLVATEEDCTARAGGACDDTGAAPICTATDACAGITECAAEGSACAGPELVTCAPDAFGCLVETTTDCTSTTFGFCDEAATPAPMCSTAAVDPCMGMTTCAAEGRTCDTDTLRVCNRNAFGCLIETATDCTATSDVCGELDGTNVCATPCAFVDTCPAGSYCAGADRVTCVADAAGCLVETARDACPTDSACFDASTCTAACTDASPLIINCASGTVSGDTTGGPTAITAYAPCTTSTNYAGSERVFYFVHEDGPANVQIQSTRGAADGDYDLFVLDGGDGTAACGAADTCVAASRGFSATETVDFVAEAGSVHYVVYDIFSSTTLTSAFTLDVTCTPIVCGDGILEADEICDDGNTATGDGCSATCELETGYYCDGVPSVCTMVMCGDSTVDPGESCDPPATGTCSANCALEIAAAGSGISLTGGLDATDPTYVRPSATCGTFTSTVPHHYDTFVIENTTGTAQTLTVTAAWTGDDGFLFAYRYPFNSDLQRFNCLRGDDDFGGTGGSQIVDLDIAVGERLVIVATTYDGGDTIASYSIAVDTD
jgi:cysteine-rich repeat protein